MHLVGVLDDDHVLACTPLKPSSAIAFVPSASNLCL